MNNESELSISYCVHSHVMFVRSSQTLLRVTQHSDKTIGTPMWWRGHGLDGVAADEAVTGKRRST